MAGKNYRFETAIPPVVDGEPDVEKLRVQRISKKLSRRAFELRDINTRTATTHYPVRWSWFGIPFFFSISAASQPDIMHQWHMNLAKQFEWLAKTGAEARSERLLKKLEDELWHLRSCMNMAIIKNQPLDYEVCTDAVFHSKVYANPDHYLKTKIPRTSSSVKKL
jgi:hypothetical protein